MTTLFTEVDTKVLFLFRNLISLTDRKEISEATITCGTPHGLGSTTHNLIFKLEESYVKRSNAVTAEVMYSVDVILAKIRRDLARSNLSNATEDTSVFNIFKFNSGLSVRCSVNRNNLCVKIKVPRLIHNGEEVWISDELNQPRS